MNTFLVKSLFFVFAGIAVAAEVARRLAGWEMGSALALLILVFCAAFAQILIFRHVLEKGNVKLGSETLPPIKDVASVLVRGEPISEEKRKALLKALARAKRASGCGSVSKEIPFQIVDRWSGTWELEAYEEIGGKRGFSINRVAYAGRNAEIVAECVGL